MRIVFCGGGTGGHVFPIIAIVRQLKKYPFFERQEFVYLGPKDDFAKFLENEGIKIKFIKAGKIRRYFSPSSFILNLFDPLKMFIGTIQSFFYLLFKRPKLIFSKGGFGALPVTIAGYLLRIPIILHESDSVPGMANRICARFAKKVLLAFPKNETKFFSLMKPEDKFVFVGNPIREEMIRGDKKIGKEIFQLTGRRPVILILGGSQGAQRINNVILEALLDLLDLFEIIHQCGQNNLKEVETLSNFILEKDQSKKIYYHLYGFLDEDQLKHAYKVADLVISRAGSGSIFEILANGLPSILVPLPEAAQDHQRENAYIVERYGAGIVIEQINFKRHFLVNKLHFLFSHPEILQEMKNNTQRLARPNSAYDIAQIIVNELKTY